MFKEITDIQSQIFSITYNHDYTPMLLGLGSKTDKKLTEGVKTYGDLISNLLNYLGTRDAKYPNRILAVSEAVKRCFLMAFHEYINHTPSNDETTTSLATVETVTYDTLPLYARQAYDKIVVDGKIQRFSKAVSAYADFETYKLVFHAYINEVIRSTPKGSLPIVRFSDTIDKQTWITQVFRYEAYSYEILQIMKYNAYVNDVQYYYVDETNVTVSKLYLNDLYDAFGKALQKTLFERQNYTKFLVLYDKGLSYGEGKLSGNVGQYFSFGLLDFKTPEELVLDIEDALIQVEDKKARGEIKSDVFVNPRLHDAVLSAKKNLAKKILPFGLSKAEFDAVKTKLDKLDDLLKQHKLTTKTDRTRVTELKIRRYVKQLRQANEARQKLKNLGLSDAEIDAYLNDG